MCDAAVTVMSCRTAPAPSILGQAPPEYPVGQNPARSVIGTSASTPRQPAPPPALSRAGTAPRIAASACASIATRSLGNVPDATPRDNTNPATAAPARRTL